MNLFAPSALTIGSPHQKPLYSSPLLAGIELRQTEVQLTQLAKDEYLHRRYVEGAYSSFGALIGRCKQLLPTQRLHLCVRYFTPLSAVEKEGNYEPYKATLSRMIAQSVIFFAPEALTQSTGCCDIQSQIFQIYTLLNLCPNREAVFNALAQSTIEPPLVGRLIKNLYMTDQTSQLYSQVIAFTCCWKRLTPLQSLTLSQHYLAHRAIHHPTVQEDEVNKKSAAFVAVMYGQKV
jgi:hypothetical protein